MMIFGFHWSLSRVQVHSYGECQAETKPEMITLLKVLDINLFLFQIPECQHPPALTCIDLFSLPPNTSNGTIQIYSVLKGVLTSSIRGFLPAGICV